MNRKLTLTIEESIIDKAKEYVKKNGKSLSEVVENYLKMISETEHVNIEESTPITDSLRGSFKAPSEFEYKDELTKELVKKYNIND